ncbi:MAG: N-acylglucosamine 2-epimerase [Balneolaceae bacterium]|nr:MAG: N-acylglucosamine 2-epimerase [Balneolaceae bacterium]
MLKPLALLILFTCLIFSICTGCTAEEKVGPDISRETIAAEIHEELEKKLVAWYPRVIDTEFGGYLSNFSYDWQQSETQDKMIVTQARHIWTLSKLAGRYPDRNYAEYATHGFKFLRDKMWDVEYGGFFQTVTRQGEPVTDQQGELGKTLYGNAFALYGLAAYYAYSGDSEVLDLAKKLFNWLDVHSHDKVYGGYFQPLTRDGTPETAGYSKDYNSGIHILEALTEFYEAWPDEVVRERLEEMFYIVRDIMVDGEGYLKLYFSEDWDHRSHRDSTEAVINEGIWYDHVTPGHDIETAFLLLEAAHVLGWDNDDSTHEITKKLTDHTLRTGWDRVTGGFYNIGYYFYGADDLKILDDSKNWWAQAEGLNTLLIMADLYPDDPIGYFEKFAMQWDYIQTYLSDHEHGGWYNYGLDKTPDSVTSMKSHIWKGNYHTVRSLLGSLERLEAARM